MPYRVMPLVNPHDNTTKYQVMLEHEPEVVATYDTEEEAKAHGEPKPKVKKTKAAKAKKHK